MKNIYAEWIDYMGAYRLYDLENPQQTIAYETDLEVAQKHALDNGYLDLILRD